MSVRAQANERLAALTAAGTSVWLDQIRRNLIVSGELKRLVREDSLRGVTSNPAIFEKAILGSTDYDEQIAELAATMTAREIFDEIAIKDVQLGCDVLRPVWDEATHADGFVSLEVEPSLAHDTDGTLEQARDYWGRVDRPNLFIKIPGTDEGVPAIEQAISEGTNVNVTLLFSVEAYESVAEAYMLGMEKRLDAGESMDVHSVASFFVSRVDTEVDKRLAAANAPEELRGTAAVANARAAYLRFKELFQGERFARLREAGCPVQRPLWASTGVKDPHYPETKYVEALVAPHTVNTMPMPTLLACAEELEVTGATADQDPAAELAALADAGIDLHDVTDKLLRDGIEKFVEPFDKLIDAIEMTREGVVTGRPPTIKASIPDELESPLIERVKQADAEGVAKRIWRKDESLWGGSGAVREGAGSARTGAIPSVRAEVCDVTDEAAVAALFERVGPVDVLVNNAGVSESAPLARHTSEAWERQLAVNAGGAFLCTRAAVPGMLERGFGRVVTVASTAGRAGYGYTAGYSASKHAAVGLMRAVAAELRATGVTANAVCPAFVRTEMTERSVARIVAASGRTAAEAEAELASSSPLGRLLEPEEVAAAVAFLASDEAGAINGQALVLDGGGIQA